MKLMFKNPLMIALLIIAFSFFSGCACNQSKKEGILKGIFLGAAAGGGATLLEEEMSDDLDPDDDLEIGIALGAIVGGIVGYFTDTCDREPVAVAAPVDTDSDGDGVVDRLDQCPDTPRGAKVDYKGCPLDTDKDGVYDYADRCPDTPNGVKVDSRGCPLDSDGDGVYDYKDKCPGTPRGTRVDSDGCSQDSDGDGVLNRMDQCPNSPKGAIVNNRGCWELEGAMFDTNKASIKSEFQSELDNVVKVLNTLPDLTIEVQGHTDSAGAESYNQKLSERRANAVKDYLVSKGIDKDRIKTKGYGESMPIASNDTEEGRAANRRATLSPKEI